LPEARSLKKFTAPEETNFLTLICSDARQKIWKAEPDFASSKLMELKLKKTRIWEKRKLLIYQHSILISIIIIKLLLTIMVI
jgi:hypothetical protein